MGINLKAIRYLWKDLR